MCSSSPDPREGGSSAYQPLQEEQSPDPDLHRHRQPPGHHHLAVEAVEPLRSQQHPQNPVSDDWRVLSCSAVFVQMLKTSAGCSGADGILCNSTDSMGILAVKSLLNVKCDSSRFTRSSERIIFVPFGDVPVVTYLMEMLFSHFCQKCLLSCGVVAALKIRQLGRVERLGALGIFIVLC